MLVVQAESTPFDSAEGVQSTVLKGCRTRARGAGVAGGWRVRGRTWQAPVMGYDTAPNRTTERTRDRPIAQQPTTTLLQLLLRVFEMQVTTTQIEERMSHGRRFCHSAKPSHFVGSVATGRCYVYPRDVI